MANKKDKEKEYAKLLFVKENLTQKEVAERCGVTEKTMSRWVRDEKWEDLKVSLLTTKEDELRRLYAQLKELNDMVYKRPEGERYANNKDADIISKLTASIRQLETETSIAQIVEVGKSLAEWLRKIDVDKAKEFVSYFDGFIKDRLK